jgi:hypothetical protein
MVRNTPNRRLRASMTSPTTASKPDHGDQLVKAPTSDSVLLP